MPTALASRSQEPVAIPVAASKWEATTVAFWAFLLLHVAVWTCLPVVLHGNLPLDCAELHYWGQEGQLGYHKHPPLPAWVTWTLATATNGSSWAIYLTAQICVACCFFSAWRLGREMVAPQTALLAVVLLECCYYYNYESMVFNNNTAMYPWWALTVLFLYWALRTGRNRYWIAVGACLGLGLLSKYSLLMLALPMLAFVVLHHEARSAWRRPGPYLAILIALLLFGPHVYWAVENNFPTLHYAASRSQGGVGLLGRVLYPLEFATAQCLALLPMIVVLLPLTGVRWRLRKVEPTERFNRDFLLAMCLGPFLLHLAVSMLLNVRLHSMWGSQLWSFAGLLMLFCLNLRSTPGCWRRVWIGCAVMSLLFVAVVVSRHAVGPYTGHVHREHFPGKTLAQRVEELWNRRFERALPVVAGDGWLGGNVAFYGRSHAQVFGVVDGLVPPVSGSKCAWMDDEQLARLGGVYLWDTQRQQEIPREMQERFPEIEPVDVLRIPYLTPAEIPPAQIGVAVIPPQ